jgi:hypothetical protein
MKTNLERNRLDLDLSLFIFTSDLTTALTFEKLGRNSNFGASSGSIQSDLTQRKPRFLETNVSMVAF